MRGPRFGAHVSISGGLFNAPQNGLEATCDVVQIFTRNQMQWRVPPLRPEDIEAFRHEVRRTGVDVVCVHASYLINLGSFDAQKLRLSREHFVIELQRAEALGIPHVVVHPGSHMGAGESAGLKRIADSLNFCLERCEGLNVNVLLETTAGQGDTLGYRFEQLAEIERQVEQRSRLGICLDTCHLFAAGYELRTPEGYDETMRELAEILGLQQVHVIHTNDSKRELGSRVDRHEHIGEGQLGLRAFAHFVRDSRFAGRAMIIETPGGSAKDAENLRRLRVLLNGRSQDLSAG